MTKYYPSPHEYVSRPLLVDFLTETAFPISGYEWSADMSFVMIHGVEGLHKNALIMNTIAIRPFYIPHEVFNANTGTRTYHSQRFIQLTEVNDLFLAGKLIDNLQIMKLANKVRQQRDKHIPKDKCSKEVC